MASNRRNWEKFGKKDPYYWVTTDAKYKDATLTRDVRRTFFENADDYLESIFKIIRRHLDPTFYPQRALDFGCGVGRITIPLARRCRAVYGIDVAESMIAEAERNCREQSLRNVTFSTDLNSLPSDAGPFDFVHSIYVFQHIRIKQGLHMAGQLIDLLKDNGAGMLHFTYHSQKTLKKRIFYWLCVHVPLCNSLNNIRKGKPFSDPMYEMNDYPLNRLFRILRQKQCDHLYARYTRDSSYDGVMFFFQKKGKGSGDFISLGDVP
ncbi:MAG: class I SAM-dependent methyltransferase [Deltaproteobacteria bacterium]|nr:class I SAM-dependent methyltransferase [Deltaproteobacteria bacterium]